MRMRRRRFLARAGGLAAGLAAGSWLLDWSHSSQALAQFFDGLSPETSRGFALPAGYMHGCFELDTPEAVERAAELGISFAVNYSYFSTQAADPDNPLGAAFARYKLKVFLDLQWLYTKGPGGAARVDLKRVRDLVRRYHQSPSLGGYWIKDDDRGLMRAAVKQVAQEIRTIDTDPSHLIMPGFGNPASVQRNYEHGQGDVLGLYLYPGYGSKLTRDLPRMLSTIRQRTPHGAKMPPVIGIYQAFGNPPQRPTPSVSAVLDSAQLFRAHGAIGLCAFSWHPTREKVAPDNTQTLRTAIGAVSGMLIEALRQPATSK